MKTLNNRTPAWRLLSKAAKTIKPEDVDDYFELKRLLASRQPDARTKFETLFASYFRLNIARLTDAFKRRYFKLLFKCKPSGKRDPYTPLLLDLYRFPRLKGDQTLQPSFVSKLVAIHDDSRPLYDTNVRNFFGVSAPSIGPIEFRISGFIQNLGYIKESYVTWTQDPKFARLTKILFRRHPQLRKCHPIRICDFLVWTVGKYKLK